MRGVRFGRQQLLTGLAAGVLMALATGGAAQAQVWKPGAKCTTRDLDLPGSNLQQMIDQCHAQGSAGGATNAVTAATYYHSARAYMQQGDYANAVRDLLRSRTELSDANVTGGNKDEIPRFKVGRAYALGQSYYQLSTRPIAQNAQDVCNSKIDCLDKTTRALDIINEEIAKTVKRKSGASTVPPTFDQYVLLRGNAYFDWDKLADARADYAKLDRQGGTMVNEARNKLGLIHIREGDLALTPPVSSASYANARRSYENAEKLPAVMYRAKVGLGDTYRGEADLPGVNRVQLLKDAVAKYLEVAPEDGATPVSGGASPDAETKAKADMGRGRALLALGERDAGVNALRRAIAVDVNGARQLELARVLANASEFSAAVAAYDAALPKLTGADAMDAPVERAFYHARDLFDTADKTPAPSRGNYGIARGDFLAVISQTGGENGVPRQSVARFKADSYYYLSLIDLTENNIGGSLRYAERASSTGGGATKYRNQVCLARIKNGRPSVIDEDSLSWCTGGDRQGALLTGMYHLRRAQISAVIGGQARLLAQQAIGQGLSAPAGGDALWIPGNAARVGAAKVEALDILKYAQAKVLQCSGLGGGSVQLGDKFNTVVGFFSIYGVDC